MSGVRTGSRLEQLEALRNRLNQEIAQERRRAILAGEITAGFIVYERPTLADVRSISKQASDRRTGALLDQLGVKARTVKEWAVTVGLLQHITHGRVPLALVQAYQRAHQTPPGGRAPVDRVVRSGSEHEPGSVPPGGHDT